jgi:hypothetical protein
VGGTAPYAEHLRVGASGLLTRSQWMPTAPLPLDAVSLAWTEEAPPPEIDGTEPETEHVRPLRQDKRRFPTYADAVGKLARPRCSRTVLATGCRRLLWTRATPS